MLGNAHKTNIQHAAAMATQDLQHRSFYNAFYFHVKWMEMCMSVVCA